MLLYKYLYCSVFLVFPFYLFPSGGFQISSLILILAFITLYLSRDDIKFEKCVIVFSVYIAYTIGVNTVWFLLTSELEFIQYIVINLFVLFTFFVSFVVARHFTRKDAEYCLYFIAGSVFIQTLIVVLDYGRSGYRAVAYFNNPNQLGYFCVLAAASALLISHIYKIKSYSVTLVVVLALILSIYSLSKAAIVACLMYLIFHIFMDTYFSYSRKILLLGLITVAASGLFSSQIEKTDIYIKLEKRIATFYTDNDANIESRGYMRITSYPEHLLFGAGEGFESRFNEKIELHSFPATILFSYGIVGSALFIIFILCISLKWRELLYLTPIFAYNLSHNGGRVLILWILMGILAAKIFYTDDIPVEKQ